MLGLIAFLGTAPSAHGRRFRAAGQGRYVLGILTLAFLILGFTPCR